MQRILILAALTAAACDRQPQKSAATPAPTTANEIVSSQGTTSKPPAVVPMPKDQAELDGLILAGYTPAWDHLHPPGVKECPLAQDSEAVM